MRDALNRKRNGSPVAGIIAVTLLSAVMLIVPLPLQAPLPAALAAGCPNAEVVFARGRYEPPGPGFVGNAFINSLRRKAWGKSIGAYAVNYDADANVPQGAGDMFTHVQYMAARCPGTRLVLGGYSLGAAVTDMVVAVPQQMFGFHSPVPAALSKRVAAVALFGNGTRRAIGPSSFNPLYAGKTIDLCNAGDVICSNGEGSWQAHLQQSYIKSGLVDQAANFVARRL